MDLLNAGFAGRVGVLVAIATLTGGRAQAQGTWNGLPDWLQLDAGYFQLSPTTTLRFSPESGPASDVELERDLGFDDTAHTFWVEGTWRLARRHSLRLGYTGLSREVFDETIQRDFTWGGETYTAGLSADAESSTDLIGGYYRFALYRSDRFEVGPPSASATSGSTLASAPPLPSPGREAAVRAAASTRAPPRPASRAPSEPTPTDGWPNASSSAPTSSTSR